MLQIKSSQCAGDWGDSEAEAATLNTFGAETGGSSNKPVAFDDSLNIAATTSEGQQIKQNKDLSAILSERQTKTSPITCIGKSETNLYGDLEFFPSHFMSKSLSADDLTCNSISVCENVNIQHSTISTVNVVPLLPKICYNNAVECIDKIVPNKEDDNLSVGSDTLSGVSDDFSCSLSINHLSEDKKTAGGGTQSDFNILSECAVSEGRKRPANTPDSAYVFMPRSEIGALKSLCQSTSADVTVDVTLELSATLENSLFNATLNDSISSDVMLSAIISKAKEVHMEKLVSIGTESKISVKSASSHSAGNSLNGQKKEVNSLQHPVKKLFKSISDDLTLDNNLKKDDERCPSEPTSISSVTLPSFSASQVADRSGSEVASFDIEELIRNSRRLLQNVDMTLEQSKGKSVRHVPSEDSSTSIDQSELPLDSVSVGFDTPDIPSNSTRCSNVSSDNHQGKFMADNTYSSIPSIALDTSRHALNPVVITDTSASLDKAIRSPRHDVTTAAAAMTAAVTGDTATHASKKPLNEKQAPEDETSSGDSFNSCNANQNSKDSSVDGKNDPVFLTLPRDSMTSKEDSTNPSDIHTQIQLRGTVDVEKDDAEPKPKIAFLARQPNFEKSDTTRSSLPKDPENALDKLMKTIGLTKLNNDSPSASNDSTSISGLTLNNSESGRDTSLNDSTKQSSSILSRSLHDGSSESNTDDQISSESTSGLKYCANPDDTDNIILIGAAVAKCVEPRVKSAIDAQGIAKPTAKSDHAFSEPLYLMSQKDRNEVVKSRDKLNQGRIESPLEIKDISGRTSVNSNENYVTASLHTNKSYKIGKYTTEPVKNVDGREECSKTSEKVIRQPKKSHRDTIAGRESVTESFSLHTCKSEISLDNCESLACITDSTNSTNTTNTKCSTDVDTYTQTSTNLNATDTTTNSTSNMKDTTAGNVTLSTNHTTSASFVNKFAGVGAGPKNKKVSLMRQTPLSELLEKYWQSSSENNGSDRRHLPEGLVKVWGAQVVSAIAALHDLGIVWG